MYIQIAQHDMDVQSQNSEKQNFLRSGPQLAKSLTRTSWFVKRG